MSARRASVLCSFAFHVALLAALALLRGPGVAEVREETALVKLRLPKAEASAGSAPATPAHSQSAAPRTSPSQPATQATDSQQAATASQPATAGTGRPIEAPRQTEVRAAAPEVRPSIDGLAAALGHPGDGSTSLPVPAERMVGVEEPGPGTSGARLPVPAASPVREPARSAASSVAAAPPVAAPRALPDPVEMIREIRGDAPPEGGGGTAPSSQEASVEHEIGVGSRTLRVQPSFPFPPELRAQGREADVTVRIRIRPDGSVLSLGVIQTSGEPAVDSAAERIVRDYLFNPVEGSTIGDGTVTFHFRLRRGF